ncbi:hypothetical protein BX600DRAFT_44605 [Xylariales sp. PMI_506]|nr:hypothetical protein BX600DRAFT_44605 [Xylariales sp. PMI_506]
MPPPALAVNRLTIPTPRSASAIGGLAPCDSIQFNCAGKGCPKEAWLPLSWTQGDDSEPAPSEVCPLDLDSISDPLQYQVTRSLVSPLVYNEEETEFGPHISKGLGIPPFGCLPLPSDVNQREPSTEACQQQSPGGNVVYSESICKESTKYTKTAMKGKTRPSGLRLDPREARSSERGENGPSARKQARSKECSPIHSSGNIEQLIQETDDAFEALGNALNEAEYLICHPDKGQETLPSVTRPYQEQAQTQTQLQPQDQASLATRRHSSRAEETRSRKLRDMKSQWKGLASRHTPLLGSGRSITGNVTELFSGRLFQKIEADEMLTPAQIENFKQKKLLELHLQTATSENGTWRSFETESSDTSIGPFHLDDLPARIGSSGVKLFVSTPVDERPRPASFNGTMLKDSSSNANHDDAIMKATQDCSLKSLTSFYDDLPSPGLPSPLLNQASAAFQPMRNPERYMLRKIPDLPTIPESISSATGRYSRNAGTDAQSNGADNNYVFLKASPFTLMAPAFRHGPIRLAKSDLPPDPKLGADDGLDWTAFQMAILGGAGDYFTDSEHMIREQEAEDVQALCDWWDEWNVEDVGGMRTRDDETLSPTTTPTLSADDPIVVGINGVGDSYYLYDEIGQDNPYSPHHEWQEPQRSRRQPRKLLDFDLDHLAPCDKLYDGGGISKWTIDGRNASRASLPQSPMLELRVITANNGDVDYIPMGYNLGHDLGDFLRWEAENVYADVSMYDGGVI